MMKLEKRIEALVYLGKQLEDYSDELQAAIKYAHLKNGWFTVENIDRALQGIKNSFLQKNQLHQWASHYALQKEVKPKTIALILAGNIPLVGFHDLLSVFITGHQAQVKLSEKDKYLLPFLVKLMATAYPEVTQYFNFTEKLESFDAVIATGSNNSARYFETYFGKYPHIIRKNRNAVAIINGHESAEELAGIATDVFTYFGLGCRNVSKLYVPENYNFEPLLEKMHEHNRVVLNSKYKNNFDYNYTLLILNKVPYLANGCILLTENQSLQSRIAGLHYEYYQDQGILLEELNARKEEIQCIVSTKPIGDLRVISPGEAQSPRLMDYADGVDTIQFLLSIA